MSPHTPGTLRIAAGSSREALKKVREALGPDALVLSNRRTRSGVEVLAVMPQVLERIAGQSPGRTAQARPVQSQPAPPQPAAPQPAQPQSPPAQAQVVVELRQLSARIAEQLGRLAWAEDARKRPLRAELGRELLAARFSGALARGLTDHLPDDFGREQARRWLAAALARNLRCAPPSGEIVTRGGVYALVGPTGVGKTTTVAKLAARCVVRHGAASLGLVSTDGYRIGAFDQLRTYGRILGVPVHTANDGAELGHALAALAGKHLVLIDTVGIGQRDARMREHLELLARPQVARVLVLSAAGQPEALEDAILVYRGAGLAGIALTKIDETVKLGGALDAAIRHRLTVLAVANGQRVPEDLHPANALYLVDRALRVAPSGPQGAPGLVHV